MTTRARRLLIWQPFLTQAIAYTAIVGAATAVIYYGVWELIEAAAPWVR